MATVQHQPPDRAAGSCNRSTRRYLTNFGNVLPAFNDPWYDPGATYSVPYTFFGTGIGYRADRIDPAQVEEWGWDTLWNATEFKGQCSILDDEREAFAMAMLRKGITDINTTDQAVIDQALADLTELIDLVNIKVNIKGYKDIPEGTTTIAHTWSADLIGGACRTCPRAPAPTVLGFWHPPTETYVVNNDSMGVMADAENPVLAHLYINYLLDNDVAEKNFSWVGYLPALTKLDADYVIDAGYVPGEPPQLRAHQRRHRQGAALPAARRRRRPVVRGRLVDVHSPADGDRASTRHAGGVATQLASRRGFWAALRAARASVAAGVLRRAGVRRDGGGVRRGRSDPADHRPGWNPLAWDFGSFADVLDRVVHRRLAARSSCAPGGSCALALARLHRRRLPDRLLRRPQGAAARAGCVLALLVLPFWISYLMRMLAWTNLLQPDGYVNDVHRAGSADRPTATGSTASWSTVVIGLDLRLRAVLHPSALLRRSNGSTAG